MIEEIEKLNINKKLETDKIKEIAKKELKQLEIKKEELERSLNFSAIKSRMLKKN